MKTIENKKKRVCFYLRNSTENQDWKFQRESLLNVFNTRNDLILVHEYAEKISGKYDETSTRPQLQNMINSIKAGDIDFVYCYDVKRLSRNAFVLKEITEICKKHNVNIFFLSENLNLLNSDLTPNPMTSMILSLLGEMAEQDRAAFIEKGAYGKQTKARAGEATGGVLPVGYTYINKGVKNKSKKIIIDENRKKVIEYIFNSYSNDNKSLGKITNELNNLKLIDSDFETPFTYDGKVIKNYKGNQWASTVIQRILKCTWYSEGYRFYKNEKIMLDESLKFIDSELWKKANILLKENQHKRQERKHTYLIKELIFCSCGQRMKTKQLKKLSDTTYQCYYSFLNNKNKNVKCICDTRAVNTEKLENAIWLIIKNKLPEFKIEVEKKTNKQHEISENIKRNNQLIEVIQRTTIKELNETRQRTINIYSKFGGDVIDFEQSMNLIDNQINEQKKMMADLKSANTMLNMSIQNLDVASEIEKNLKIIESDKSLIKLYINKLVKKVVVGGGLLKSWNNVCQIIWSEYINNDSATYIVFNSRLKDNPNYYYINEINGVSVIVWNSEKKIFRVVESKREKVHDLTIEEIINHYNMFHNPEFDKLEMNVNLAMVTKDNYELFSKDYSIFNKILGNCAKLEIVTPFI